MSGNLPWPLNKPLEEISILWESANHYEEWEIFQYLLTRLEFKEKERDEYLRALQDINIMPINRGPEYLYEDAVKIKHRALFALCHEEWDHARKS